MSLPDEGLAIWHVDEDGSNNNEHMTPDSHYELSLEQADGRFSLETSSGHPGDETDLYGQGTNRFGDTTTPSSRWWDGTASNLEIFDIEADGDEAHFRARLFQSGAGAQSILAESSPRLAIPDNRAAGISDTIKIAQDATIVGVQVALDISHTYRGDLSVELQTPWNAIIALHRRHQGGDRDDIRRTVDEADLQALASLHGHSTMGDWTLLVRDLAPDDVGRLNRWALTFDAAERPQGPVVLEEAPGKHIPDDNPAGIARALSTNAAGSVGSVEVSVDISHTWISDLRISIRSPEGTEAVLHDHTGGSADDVVRTYTASTTPDLQNLAGEPISGEWQLRVSDHVGQDFGKLNAWRVVIQPA